MLGKRQRIYTEKSGTAASKIPRHDPFLDYAPSETTTQSKCVTPDIKSQVCSEDAKIEEKIEILDTFSKKD